MGEWFKSAEMTLRDRPQQKKKSKKLRFLGLLKKSQKPPTVSAKSTSTATAATTSTTASSRSPEPASIFRNYDDSPAFREAPECSSDFYSDIDPSSLQGSDDLLLENALDAFATLDGAADWYDSFDREEEEGIEDSQDAADEKPPKSLAWGRNSPSRSSF